MKKLLLLAIVVLGISAVSFGQEISAKAASSATIITHIDIDKVDDLKFGGIVTSATGGNVTILAQDGAKPTASGDLKIPTSNFGDSNPAKFLVKGEKKSTYAISLRNTSISLNGPNSKTMTLNLTLSKNTGTIDQTSGEDNIFVGGVLVVGPSQDAGLYENAEGLEVIVNYN